MEGWGKVVAGVVLGVAGTVYATNRDLRERLPANARDLPENVRRRFDSAVSAAREASSRRREEILRELEQHEAAQAAAHAAARDARPVAGAAPEPAPAPAIEPAGEPVAGAPETGVEAPPATTDQRS
jgi:cation transport regulator ChaB